MEVRKIFAGIVWLRDGWLLQTLAMRSNISTPGTLTESSQPRGPEAPLTGMRALLRLPTVMQATGLCRSTIYKLVAEKEFPAPVQLTARALAWRQGDVERWAIRTPCGASPGFSDIVEVNDCNQHGARWSAI